MTPLVAQYIQICNWDPARYLLVSANVFSPLIYYSHLLPLLASLIIGVFIMVGAGKTQAAKYLFYSILLLDIWLLFDLILWATEIPAYTMFFWSMINMIEPIIYVGLLFFLYYFIDKRPPALWQNILLFLAVTPVVIAAPTHFALEGYDLTNCNREAIEGITTYYSYILESFIAIWIVGFTLRRFIERKNKNERKEIALVGFGTVFLLVSFAIGNVIGSLFVNWTIGQYGLFGIPVFVALLSYVIVTFRAFNIKLIATQAIVVGLWLLTFAILFAQSFKTIRTIVIVTLVLFGILGYQLIRSVQREIRQRERIEFLAKDLEQANKQQVALIHFITHQLKGFVSKSRNIFAMIQEGDYGPVPEAMKPMIDEGFASATKGAQTIQEILNAANIKSGKVAYSMAPFDLSALIRTIVENLKPNADAKNVALTLTMPETPVIFTGDQMQLENAFKNLIDNTIKYTPQGSITLTLEEDAQRIRFTTKDTGVGITPEDMQHLFTEGGHGAESTKVNVDSTGFGLYIVKNIIEGHKGTVKAESEGAGKGSTFTVELPVDNSIS